MTAARACIGNVSSLAMHARIRVHGDIATCRPKEEFAKKEAPAPATAKEAPAKRKASPPPKKDVGSPSAKKGPPPDYAPKLPAAPLAELACDYKTVKDAHARLYIPADFSKLAACWAQVRHNISAADVRLHDVMQACPHASVANTQVKYAMHLAQGINRPQTTQCEW